MLDKFHFLFFVEKINAITTVIRSSILVFHGLTTKFFPSGDKDR